MTNSLLPEYRIWAAMKRRCYNPNVRYFSAYGGRGIAVCDRWRYSFVNFLTDMGPRPAGGTLERSNVNGNYSPDNCCWASIEQQQNNRRNNIVVDHAGRSQTLTQWCREIGVPYARIRARIQKLGMTPSDALAGLCKLRDDRTPQALYLHGGESRTLGEWCQLRGIKYQTLWRRMFVAKMPFSEALVMKKHCKSSGLARNVR